MEQMKEWKWNCSRHHSSLKLSSFNHHDNWLGSSSSKVCLSSYSFIIFINNFQHHVQQDPIYRLKVTVSFAETLQIVLGSILSLRSTNHHDYHDDCDISNHDINMLWTLLFFQCVNYTFEWIPNNEWFTPLFNLSTPLAEINNASRPVRKSRASKTKTTNIFLNISNLQLVLILSIADWSVSMRAPWYGLEWHWTGMLCNRTFVFFSKLFSQHYK